MKIGEFKVECVFYNKKQNIRIPMCQIFSDKANVDCWVEWLKNQDEIVTITVTKQTKYGEETILYWW